MVVVICHVCDAPSTGQCQRCGKFYCRKHGDIYCEECEPEETLLSGPEFLPSNDGLHLVVAPVSGYQELMEILRALNGARRGTRAYSTLFLNGEASYQIVPQSPIAARKILDMVAAATGEELFIEECRPDAQRLRLRFASRLMADPRAIPGHLP